jgi:hypothetical protein
MHQILSVFLISYSGWTLAVHLGLLVKLHLATAIAVFLILTLVLLVFYMSLRKDHSSLSTDLAISSIFLRLKDTRNRLNIYLLLLVVTPAIMLWSWNAFWMISILVLLVSLLRKDTKELFEVKANTQINNRSDLLIVYLIGLIMVLFSYWVSRSSLDDAFYVAVAAFASSKPALAFSMVDPTLGEIDLPLIFPSYRFSSFELLSGAGAYLFSVPAMDFYYIYLLPIWVVVSVVVIFLFTKEFIKRYWLINGILALVLIFLLGEMHRSPANFSFVRIFQGKAVFLSIIVPAIFYLTARYSSARGTKADLFLLGCCQITSVGLTNFGMLMGPIAGFTSLISNILLVRSGNLRKFLYALAVLFIPLPYLVSVALESRGSPMLTMEYEPASSVWISVFGTHQQYLVGILLLAGPILAKDSLTRWRLAIPPLFLYTIFLNPFFSKFISSYVTTPPVYWRVVWIFPTLLFVAISLFMIMLEVGRRRFHFLARSLLLLVIVFFGVYSLPFNTLREENNVKIVGFAEWKIPRDHLIVSQITMENVTDGGRVLAPDEIAGVISRFENHPRLITSRGLYLDLMRSSFPPQEYEDRSTLHKFVNSNIVENLDTLSSALRIFNVKVVVLHANSNEKKLSDVMRSQNYKLQNLVSGYSIWVKYKL